MSHKAQNNESAESNQSQFPTQWNEMERVLEAGNDTILTPRHTLLLCQVEDTAHICNQSFTQHVSSQEAPQWVQM